LAKNGDFDSIYSYVGRKNYHWFVKKTRKNIKKNIAENCRKPPKNAENRRKSDHIIDPSYMGIFRSQVAFS
jgi:hypothetical protein